jgi:hypothetical protein
MPPCSQPLIYRRKVKAKEEGTKKEGNKNKHVCGKRSYTYYKRNTKFNAWEVFLDIIARPSDEGAWREG